MQVRAVDDKTTYYLDEEIKMITEYNDKDNEWKVTLSINDLQSAFQSERDLQTLLHSIVEQTYGRYVADNCFPLD